MRRFLLAGFAALAVTTGAGAASADSYDLFYSGGSYDGRELDRGIIAGSPAQAVQTWYREGGVAPPTPLGCLVTQSAKPAFTAFRTINRTPNPDVTKYVYNKRLRPNFVPTSTCPKA